MSSRVLLQEKPHIVNKLINLTPEQKQEINAFFASHKNLENRIDWNKGQKLTYQDFKVLMDANAGTIKNKLKRVKSFGIEGMKEGEDYIRIPIPDPNIVGVVPLNHDASRMIASTALLGVEGEWCIAYQHDTKYWNDYTGQGYTFLILLMYSDNEKYALQIKGKSITVWTKEDSRNDLSWFCSKYGLDPQMVKEWAKLAEGESEGKVDREETFTYEIESFWWVSQEKGYITLGVSYIQNQYDEEGEDHYEQTEGSETYEASVNIYIIEKGSTPPPELENALAEGKFNWSKGTGIYVEQTSPLTFEEASTKASRNLEGEFREPYLDDARAEIYEFLLGHKRPWERNKLEVFTPDFVISKSFEDCFEDVELRDMLEYAVDFNFSKNQKDSQEFGNFIVYAINSNIEDYIDYGKADWEGLNQDVPSSWDSPEQQHFNFNEHRNLHIMKLLLE